MNSSFATLFFAEHRRIFTTITSVVLSGFIVMGWGFIYIPFLISQQNPNAAMFWAVTFPFHDFIISAALFILAVGIVSNDIKEGWLRTILIRPIKRETFLTIKLLATLSVVLEVFIAACIIPTILFFSVTSFSNIVSVWYIVLAYAALMMTIIQLSLLYAFFSCYVPGIYNVILVAVWSVGEGMLVQYVSANFSDVKIVNLLTPYIYPNGWSEVMNFAIRGVFDAKPLLWGCCSLAFSTALAFRSFNTIQIEAGSE